MARDFKEKRDGRRPRKHFDRLNPRQAGLLALDDAIDEQLEEIAEINSELGYFDDEWMDFDFEPEPVVRDHLDYWM